MEADFLARGNGFLPFSWTALNCYLWKHIFSTGAYFSADLSFRLVETSFLFTGNCIFLKFFAANGKYYWNLREVKFWRRTIFLLVDNNFFDFSRHFLWWKSCFRIVKGYFSTSFTRLVQTNFLPMEKVIFWSESFCCY